MGKFSNRAQVVYAATCWVFGGDNSLTGEEKLKMKDVQQYKMHSRGNPIRRSLQAHDLVIVGSKSGPNQSSMPVSYDLKPLRYYLPVSNGKVNPGLYIKADSTYDCI